MYAITASSYRAITSAEEAMPGETVVAELPQSLIDAMAAEKNNREATMVNLRNSAETALIGLRAYRDNASPTNAETVIAVRLLCRVAIALIRIQISRLDAEN